MSEANNSVSIVGPVPMINVPTAQPTAQPKAQPKTEAVIPFQPGQPLPKLPDPVFPSMDMPESPVIPGIGRVQQAPDGEGFANLDLGENPNIPHPAEGSIRILIGIPMLDIKYEFFESFLKFWTQLGHLCKVNPKIEVAYQIAYRKPVHMAEEYLVQVAKHNKCTHLLLMDDDIYDVTVDDLVKLIAADKDVIGGVMHASKFPHAMCVFRRFIPERKVIDMPSDNSMYRLYEVPCNCPHCGVGQSHWDAPHCMNCGNKLNNLVQQADLIPFAMTLIKMSVFDKIKKPWFHCTNKYPTDSWFADRLLEAGLKEYAHMGVRLNHAGITDETKPYYTQMGMAKAQKAKAIVHIEPQQMEVHQYLLHNKMQEAESRLKPKPLVVTKDGLLNNDQPKDMTLMSHGH